jgi:hypothetical protein
MCMSRMFTETDAKHATLGLTRLSQPTLGNDHIRRRPPESVTFKVARKEAFSNRVKGQSSVLARFCRVNWMIRNNQAVAVWFRDHKTVVRGIHHLQSHNLSY